MKAEDAVAALKTAADTVSSMLAGYDPGDWRDAVRLLAELREPIETLRTLDAGLSRWIYLHGEHGMRVRVEGVGDVAIGRGRSRERWDGRSAVLDYVGVKITETGGVAPDPDQVASWVLDVVPDSRCRVTPLREAGLDVEDYRHSEPGTITVTIPKV